MWNLHGEKLHGRQNNRHSHRCAEERVINIPYPPPPLPILLSYRYRFWGMRRTSKLNSKTVPVLPSLIFPFYLPRCTIPVYRFLYFSLQFLYCYRTTTVVSLSSRLSRYNLRGGRHRCPYYKTFFGIFDDWYFLPNLVYLTRVLPASRLPPIHFTSAHLWTDSNYTHDKIRVS